MVQKVKQYFEILKSTTLQPDLETYHLLISNCIPSFSLEEAMEYFKELVEKFQPTLYSFNLLLFCFSKYHPDIKMVLEILENREIEPCIFTLTKLISLSQKNAESEWLFEKCLQILDEQQIRPDLGFFNALFRFFCNNVNCFPANPKPAAFNPITSCPTTSPSSLQINQNSPPDLTILPVEELRSKSLVQQLRYHYNHMVHRFHIIPDSTILRMLISICCNIRALDEADFYYSQFQKFGIYPKTNLIKTLIRSHKLFGNAAQVQRYQKILSSKNKQPNQKY